METSYLLSFLAGIASILSPCVLPLIPVIVGFSLLKRTNLEIVAFGLGFFLLFAIIASLTALLTAAINYYLLYFRIAAALILVVIGLLFIFNKNLFNISTNLSQKGSSSSASSSYASQTSTSRKGVAGSFVIGFLTCLAWSPCFGPYVVAVATYSASSGDVVYSIINMALFAGGFSLTILVMAFLMSKIDLKPLIKYSNWIRVISGIIIALAGIYMLIGFL
jgi:cytochrome c-type biogenesis protein